MKKILLLALLCLPTALFAAHNLREQADSTHNDLELRAMASFTKDFKSGVSIGLTEDLRFNDMVRQFGKSYTTLELTYRPVDWFKVGAGYRLKIYGDKGWSDYNEFLRHAAYVDLTFNYKINSQWKLSFKERVMGSFRTDSLNAYEAPKNDFALRHRLSVDYNFFSKPMKIYANVELINTLNQVTDLHNIYVDGTLQETVSLSDAGLTNLRYNGGQYLSSARAWVGFKYRFDKNNSLNFFYKFEYNYKRDINYTRKLNVEVQNIDTYKHIIGIAYEFGW